MKEIIINLLKKALNEKNIKLEEQEIDKVLEIPPSIEMGDYSFPCFFLAEKLKQGPNQIALEIREKIKNLPSEIEDIQTSGPYINFFLNRKNFAIALIKEVLDKKEAFGKLNYKDKKTMVEFPSPNTNKPLHLGHLRNMAIGESISRILEFNGEKVIKANLNNDRGIHICQSMAAYKKYGKNKEPTKKIKSDHFVGNFYVLFNKKSKKNKKLEIESHQLLQKWEQGDEDTIKLWKKMNKWALDGFKKTYKKFEIGFDKEYYESEIYAKGKEIILDGVKKGIFEKKEGGAVIVNLTKENLGEKFLLRPDQTSLYITQDLYLAKLKFDQFKLNNSIYITGNEQEYHFNVLFTILKKLGFNFSNNLHHLSYGMVVLPHGKMKSREGIIVDADDLIENVQELVKKELQSREKLSKKELELRSLKIALAAIKYLLLKVDIKKNMLFNPKESINFEGDTGPYIQYSYARACSILKKLSSKTKDKTQFKISELAPEENELIKKLSQFKEVVLSSCKSLNPALIANYSYQLAQLFNEFYHTCPVIDSEKESFRIAIVKTFKQILKNSLFLLGIDVIEKM